MQKSLFKPQDILTDELQRVVEKVRNDLKPTAKIIHLSDKKRQLFSCSNVRKTTHGNSKYS